ncbi:MAG TPA: GNAT family N-acetyltransferase [Solirubrobacteraceae bacterium]|nr:GNAT family N-acetyltransferase [Solirubrobacteraceae bacterium]
MHITDFSAAHLDAVIAMCVDQGWETLSEDPRRTLRSMLAPGALTLVAIDDRDQPVGFAHTLSDGHIQAYLARLLVAEGSRRQGIGRALLEASLRRSGALRLDLIAAEEAAPFYRSLPHHEWSGFRVVLQELDGARS